LLRDRVASVATIASAGPSDADDLDFMAGMGPGNVAEFGLARQGEDALRPALEEEAAGLAGVDVAQMAETLRPHCTEVDYAIAAGELGPYLLQTFRSGTAHGVDGWVDDDLAFTRPWGFDIADIRTPVLLIQGRQDLMVPFEHGQWLARHVPGAEARLFEDEGHLTPFVSRARELHEWLLAHL
jgi:pimeloyl-ACP methyl ester carboxylesterase